jgi:hypothetical protein
LATHLLIINKKSQKKKKKRGKGKKAKIQKLWSCNPKSCGKQMKDMMKL